MGLTQKNAPRQAASRRPRHAQAPPTPHDQAAHTAATAAARRCPAERHGAASASRFFHPAAAPLPCRPPLPRAHRGCDGRRQRLSGRQSRAAGTFLRARWELATVWQPDEKAALTAQINALFVAAGDPPLYSVRKLEDWLSNARYRANCKKRTRVPDSWSAESRAQARQKAQRQRRAEAAPHPQSSHATTTAAAAVPAAATTVKDILVGFEALAEAGPMPVESGPGEQASRPVPRSESFSQIRERFERDGFGRTDMWASHRGDSAAPSSDYASWRTTGDAAHFAESELNRSSSPKDADSGLVPTFLSVAGLPLPPTAQPVTGLPLPPAAAAVPANDAQTAPAPVDDDLDLLDFDMELDLDELPLEVLSLHADDDIEALPEPPQPPHPPEPPQQQPDPWMAGYRASSAGLLSSAADNAGEAAGTVAPSAFRTDVGPCPAPNGAAQDYPGAVMSQQPVREPAEMCWDLSLLPAFEEDTAEVCAVSATSSQPANVLANNQQMCSAAARAAPVAMARPCVA